LPASDGLPRETSDHAAAGKIEIFKGHYMKESSNTDSKKPDSDRREFLRKSIYAAYATPIITALLVEEASAANSINGACSRRWCENKGLSYPCCP
jgi:hypothetical protein